MRTLRVLSPPRPGATAVPALTGAGIDTLTRRITAHVRARVGDSEAPVITQARHRQQLERCAAPLRTFLGFGIEHMELRAEACAEPPRR